MRRTQLGMWRWFIAAVLTLGCGEVRRQYVCSYAEDLATALETGEGRDLAVSAAELQRRLTDATAECSARTAQR